MAEFCVEQGICVQDLPNTQPSSLLGLDFQRTPVEKPATPSFDLKNKTTTKTPTFFKVNSLGWKGKHTELCFQ